MKQSKNMCVNISDVKSMIEQLIETFKSDELLSVFEMGQVDALRWVIDCLQEIKTPEKN